MLKIDKQMLKAKAHHLNPVVIIGTKGLTAAVIEETNIALEAHELIKVKINAVDKAEKLTIATSLSAALHANFIQLIGSIATFYRKRQDNA
jgi:RNA-binding protein